ncbi:hypothetical protein [Labilithrix luteola]|uniref:hypothetical protein n=1 Tax=Labilithrix luteola TaxID=1391654 RepID=UPI0011BA59EC|nr:hypothetical protein [Labilithrix luteola]
MRSNHTPARAGTGWQTDRVVRFACTSLLGVGVVGTSACGQVTGLSDDYTFDLDGGDGQGTTIGADGGDGGSDASSRDSGPLADASSKCQGPTGTNAYNALSGGAPACQACLAAQCCSEVLSCYAGGGSDCRSRFQCLLQCTDKPTASERTACFNGCNPLRNDSVSRAMSSCADQSCRQDCAF